MNVLPTGRVFQAGVDLLDSLGAEYMVIGGIAAGAWGDPRDTKDADFVLALACGETATLLLRARERGFDLEEQVVEMNLELSGVARLFYGGRHIDLILGETEFDRSALSRSRTLRLYDRDVRVTSPEDLILYKLVAMRERDIDDIRRVLIRQRDKLDRGYIRRWARELGERLHRTGILEKLEELLDDTDRGLEP